MDIHYLDWGFRLRDGVDIFRRGVSQKYRGQGLATGLVRRILSHAKRRGFWKDIADSTGPASLHTCERCGFFETAHVAYDDFLVTGKAFFHGLPGGISLMIRDV